MRAMAAALLACLCGARAVAQTTDTGPLLLDLPSSTRALAMGGAYPILAYLDRSWWDDADVVFFNPALLKNARGTAMSLQRYGSASTLVSVAAATDVGFGIGVQVLDYAANRQVAGDIGSALDLGRRGDVVSSEVLGAVGYTRSIKGLRVGVTAKWVQHWGENRSEGVAAFDIGTALAPTPWLNVVFAAQQLGGTFRFRDIEYDLPARLTLLLSTTERAIGPIDVTFAARANLDRHRARGGVGIEAYYFPYTPLIFYARAGLRSRDIVDSAFEDVKQSRFTAGGGVTFRRFSLDYAWEPFDHSPDAHRVGLRFR